jgi:hypothetical protein
MRPISKLLLTSLAALQLAALTSRAQLLYQLDNGNFTGVFNASEGTEPLDNWFATEFTALPGATLINRVDFYSFTTTPNSTASISIYRVTGAGGNPAAGATRLYTQSFTPPTGNNTNVFLSQIGLTSPVALNAGDKFLVSILIRNVIAAPPNDVYPFVSDNAATSAGSYWDRSTPNTFNLDNITGAVPLDQPLTPGGFAPGPGELFIRAFGVPEPTSFAFCGLGIAALVISRRNKR